MDEIERREGSVFIDIAHLFKGEGLSSELAPHSLVVRERGGGVLASPRPHHGPLALVLGLVEVTRGAVTLAYHGAWLQSVGEDDVGVHGPHVQVVDQRSLLAVWTVSQHLQSLHN